jgi:hypothetical protein
MERFFCSLTEAQIVIEKGGGIQQKTAPFGAGLQSACTSGV